MAGDGERTPACKACPFIGRICPPDCPLAPHFNSGRTHAVLKDSLGRSVTECARSYHSQELRRIFVKGAVKFFARDSAGGEGRRLLVEAVLSEAEKGLEPPPKPALRSSRSSTDPRFSSPGDITPFSKTFARVEWTLEACLRVQDSYDNDGDDGDDDDAHEVELAGSETPLEESGSSTGIDQNLGVNADQDSILAPDKD